MTEETGERVTESRVVDAKWRDPYRWACPQGHIFRREFDPRGAIECYRCQTTYAKAELVDRRSEHQARPWADHHARRHGP